MRYTSSTSVIASRQTFKSRNEALLFMPSRDARDVHNGIAGNLNNRYRMIGFFAL